MASPGSRLLPESGLGSAGHSSQVGRRGYTAAAPAATSVVALRVKYLLVPGHSGSLAPDYTSRSQEFSPTAPSPVAPPNSTLGPLGLGKVPVEQDGAYFWRYCPYQ